MARRVGAVVVALALLVAAGWLLVARRGETPSPSLQQPEQVSRTPQQRPAGGRRWPLGAHLVRRTQLRESPGGRVVRALGLRTNYGSERVLAVVARRPGWIGVLSHFMPNSRAGWIPADSAQLRFEPYVLRVDRSERMIRVELRNRVVRRIRVAVGRPGEETPTGRYAITDLLRVSTGGGPYGCCALALTGRQPHIPQGWTGGDRIAIHGTSNEASIGTPASGGCMRASDRDMRWLMERIPLGTQVRIRA